MADRNWRTDPHIQEAKRVAQSTGSRAVIVLLLTEETLRVATYGQNGRLCTFVGKLGDVAFDAVMQHLSDGEAPA
jgi:ABC-type enterochelin transport system substrate-binding protein